MGKLICDSTASSPLTPWKDPTSTPSLTPLTQWENVTPSTSPLTPWENVSGLEEQQRRSLTKLQAKGVLWKHKDQSIIFRLSHGGEVDGDGNCLFTASSKAMGGKVNARELRRRTVERFLMDLGAVCEEEKVMIELAVRNMYEPDLRFGWGIHVVQELKLLANKSDRESLDKSIHELTQLDMQR